jgi:hypothetical protein
MYRKLSLVAGLAIAAAVAGAHGASAGVATPMAPSLGAAESGNALVQKADWDDWRYRRYRRYDRDYDYDYRYRYYDRCQYWRRECAGRWGWGGGDYRRCLWRHGC